MAFTVKLQSPAYDNNGNGEEIPLPVSVATYGGNSLAAIVTLFKGENKLLDFAQLREVIQLTGVLGPTSSVTAGFDNPTDMRDRLRNIRGSDPRLGDPWTLEDGTVAGANWGTGTLPAAEKDSGTTRGTGKIRLIFDKRWSGSAFENFFLYGTVADFSFPNIQAASFRDRIPFGLTFFVGSVEIE